VAAKPFAYVLDSFAVLAYLGGEAGMSRVKEILKQAEAKAYTIDLSLINLGEVLYITERENGLVEARQVLAAIDQLPVQIVPVSRDTVLAVAHVKARYPFLMPTPLRWLRHRTTRGPHDRRSGI
jgi:PIN domain nuclease of toxin-antitoxin system